MLEELDISQEKNVILIGDFNFFTNTKLEAVGGSSALQKKSVAKVIEIKEGFELYNILRIRKPTSQRYTFRNKHFLGLIQQRLDYIFLSNSHQEFVSQSDILPVLSIDFCLVALTMSKSQNFTEGNSVRNFDSSLIYDNIYVSRIKELIGIKSKRKFC